MIVDVTGIELTPGNNGNNCLGNGEHLDENGKLIDCCCDECDYLICCLSTKNHIECHKCSDELCPRSKKNKKR